MIKSTPYKHSLIRPINKYFYQLNHSKPIHYQREYFYFIDCHGQLYLEDTKPKNFTTCFKDIQFLNFFFKRVKFNSIQNNNYPYISLCGKEINFIQSEDSPIVFHDLNETNDVLKWGGNFEFPFQPDKISVCNNSGRVYHPLPFDLKSPFHNRALLKSSVVLTKLSSFINFEEKFIEWKNQRYPIEFIEAKNKH